MSVHAFIDESTRRNVYIMAAIIVNPGDLTKVRQSMRSLLVPGAREVHFNNEKDPRRREVADAVARLPVEMNVYSRVCKRLCESARQACLAKMTEDLLASDAHRMVLDTRNTMRGADRDKHDRETIKALLGERPSDTHLTYEHVPSTSEELLWVADAAVWCWGLGGAWRRRIGPIIGAEVSLGECPLENAKPGRLPSGRKTGSTSLLHRRSA
jgi:hypothetical protein